MIESKGENYLAKKIIGYAVLIVASVATAILTVKSEINNQIAMIVFLLWGLIPYIILGYVLKNISELSKNSTLSLIAIMAISLAGLYAMVDIMFIHPDPQGGLALLMVPLFQFIAIGFMLLIPSK